MKVTYYLEVISSWCHWAEPAWAELKTRFAGRAEFSWKLALMDASGLPVSRDQCEWFYRRSGTIVRSTYMLNAGWFEPGVTEYLAPNLVAEAARDLVSSSSDDRVRLALAHAALREGRKVADWQVAAEIGADAAGLDAGELLAHAQSRSVEARARASTAEFYGLGVNQRPAFLLENAVGDRAIFSGLASAPPLISAMDALLSDEAAQVAYTAHHGGPPA